MNPTAEAPSQQERSEKDIIRSLQEEVSASRLSLFLQCRLKFYYRYVLRLKKPKTASLHVGNSVHSALKAWSKALTHILPNLLIRKNCSSASANCSN